MPDGIDGIDEEQLDDLQYALGPVIAHESAQRAAQEGNVEAIAEVCVEVEETLQEECTDRGLTPLDAIGILVTVQKQLNEDYSNMILMEWVDDDER